MRWSKWIAISALAVGAVLVLQAQVTPELAISADGLIESTAGGFKFPDGTVQQSAATLMGECPTMDPSDEMIWVGGTCIDKYEASIWDEATGGSQITGTIPCSLDGQDCDNIWARSVAGVEPRGDITWFQAQAALANSGKRLPTNAEWQRAAMGTPDPGGSPGSEDCNTNSSSVEVTGERTNCVSRWDHHDMVGNLAEWVADWDEVAAGCETWATLLNEDRSCMGRMDGDSEQHLQGAFRRGGDWEAGTDAGVFSVNVTAGPPNALSSTGFRGAR